MSETDATNAFHDGTRRNPAKANGDLRSKELLSWGETLVAIPAYNEAATIGSVVLAAKKYTDQVLVFDDGSSDETAWIAETAGAVVFEGERNGGKGAAVNQIFRLAREFDVARLVLLDADWQHDPHEIPKLLDPIESDEADVVIGSRYLEDRSDETPRYRRFGQQILDLLNYVSGGTAVTDSQSGYRAFARSAIDSIDVTERGFGVEMEMLQSASKNDLDVREVPIGVNYDVPDANTSNSFLHGVAVVDVSLRIIRDRHPLLFFGIPGVGLMLLGLAYGGWTISIYHDGSPFYLGKALFSALLLIVGILSVYSALLMNMIGNRLEQLE